jgi:4-hydroxybenzoate polyprenyltransferase
LTKLGHVVDAIKFEHTVFALPFAYIAMVLAARGWPGLWTVGWVTAAMVGARTCAMATNRVVDRLIDARNPRTASRHLPRGLLGAGEMKLLAAAGAVLMFVAAAMLNPLCLALSPLALLFVVGYSYTKYFTWTSHWILGFTDGMPRPAAGSRCADSSTRRRCAVVRAHGVDRGLRPDVRLPGRRLFDRNHGLHSVPARFGVSPAFWLARVNHVLTAAALAALGILASLGPLYWVGWVAVVALLVYEHSLVSPRDLRRLDIAFFNVNGYIAVIVLVAVVGGLWR